MLIKSFLNRVTDDDELRIGRKLKGFILKYGERKVLSNIYDVKAVVLEKGEIYNVQLFLNTEKEFLSDLNCSCYHYGVCRHIVAAVMNFVQKNDIKYKREKEHFYDYKICSSKLIVNYNYEILKWIDKSFKHDKQYDKHLNEMTQDERKLLYYLVHKQNFNIDETILKMVSQIIDIPKNLTIKKVKYKICLTKNDQIKILEEKQTILDDDISVKNEKLLKYNDIKLSAKFLFEDLPTFNNDENIEIDEELKKYKLKILSTKCKVTFKNINNRVYLLPEIEMDSKIYKDFELLLLTTNYSNKDKYNYERIDKQEYKRLLNFLKTKNLDYKEHGFLCKLKFWKNDYLLIPKSWEKIGISDLKIKCDISVDFLEETSLLNFEYYLDKKILLENDLKKIKRTGLLRKSGLIYYVKNFDIIFQTSKTFTGTMEDVLSKMEEYRHISNVYLKKDFLDLDLPVKYDFLRKYQKDGVAWLKFLNKHSYNGILADDMGLGKTVQTLVFLQNLKEEGTTLIVAPKSVIYNWESEINEFLKSKSYVLYEGPVNKRTDLLKKIRNKKFIITSYGILKKDFEKLKKINFLYIVLDEAQHIKNENTLIWSVVKNLKSKNKLALTGTPIENSLKNLWAIFEFLMPGHLNCYEYYSSQNKIEELKYRAKPFILRRTKAKVLKELPDKIEKIFKIELEEEQRLVYEELLSESRKKVLEKVEKSGLKKSFFTIFSALTYLREVCDHPQLIGKEGSSSKVKIFNDLIDDLIEGGHKIIVFSQFVKMLKILTLNVKEKGIKYEILTGETVNRKEKIKLFNTDESIKIFFISLTAGGEGVNLTAADTIIHFDPWWNPMVEKQATDRAHRIGQTKHLNVYKLIAKDTIEDKVLEIQKNKTKLFKNVINDGKNIFKYITVKDVENMFKEKRTDILKKEPECKDI